MNNQSFFFLQTKKYPIPRIIASEKTKLVIRVVVSLLSSGSEPLLILNKNSDNNVPAPTDNIIIINLLLFDMLQRKKRMKYPIAYLAVNCYFFYLFCDLRRNVSGSPLRSRYGRARHIVQKCFTQIAQKCFTQIFAELYLRISSTYPSAKSASN